MKIIYEELSPIQKTWVKTGSLAFGVLLILFLLALLFSYGIGIWKEFKAVRVPELQISVGGQGKVTAKPDVVRLTATILSQGKILSEVQKDNTGRLNLAVDFLKKNGVGEKDIKTIGYNIFPQYSYPRPCRIFPCLEDEKPEIIGYQIRNTLEITIRDTVRAGEILSGVVDAGVNEISSFQFAIDDPEALKAEARKKAIDNARLKAERLAKDLDMKVGKTLSFSESGVFPPPIFFAGKAVAVEAVGPTALPSPEVQPGENEIIIDVVIIYEFK